MMEKNAQLFSYIRKASRARFLHVLICDFEIYLSTKFQNRKDLRDYYSLPNMHMYCLGRRDEEMVWKERMRSFDATMCSVLPSLFKYCNHDDDEATVLVGFNNSILNFDVLQLYLWVLRLYIDKPLALTAKNVFCKTD